MLHKTQSAVYLSKQALATGGLGHPWAVWSKIQCWPTWQCWPGSPHGWRRHWWCWEPGLCSAGAAGPQLHKKQQFPASVWWWGKMGLEGGKYWCPQLAMGPDAGCCFPPALGQGKGSVLFPHQICHYFKDRARGLENILPFWHGLSLCWDFSELWNETKLWTLVTAVQNKQGLGGRGGPGDPTWFSTPVVSGRDELTSLLPSCPADPVRQEMSALLWASLPATGGGREMSPKTGLPCCCLAVWSHARRCRRQLCLLEFSSVSGGAHTQAPGKAG